MKKRKMIIAVASLFLIIATLSSCHHNTCPTFSNVDQNVQLEECM